MKTYIRYNDLLLFTEQKPECVSNPSRDRILGVKPLYQLEARNTKQDDRNTYIVNWVQARDPELIGDTWQTPDIVVLDR